MMTSTSETSTSTMIPPSSASLEIRIAALETRVGRMTAPASTPISVQEVSSRLDKLQATMDTNLNSVQIKEIWNESLKLIKELDPDIALTYQQQPLLYKRQQLLAAATLLKQDMQQLDVILKLLTTETTAQQQLRLEQVTHAPIVASPRYAQSPKDQERLDKLRLQYSNLHQRIQMLQHRLHTMLQCYHTTITACSQKLVLAQEKAERQGKV